MNNMTHQGGDYDTNVYDLGNSTAASPSETANAPLEWSNDFLDNGEDEELLYDLGDAKPTSSFVTETASAAVLPPSASTPAVASSIIRSVVIDDDDDDEEDDGEVYDLGSSGKTYPSMCLFFFVPPTVYRFMLAS
jgi:hypothetical protein